MEKFELKKPINHIAFIMDGNGRWAKRRLMPRTYGHKVACKRIIEIVRFLREINVRVVSLYAFSTENWNRKTNVAFKFLVIFQNYLKIHKKPYKTPSKLQKITKIMFLIFA